MLKKRFFMTLAKKARWTLFREAVVTGVGSRTVGPCCGQRPGSALTPTRTSGDFQARGKVGLGGWKTVKRGTWGSG